MTAHSNDTASDLANAVRRAANIQRDFTRAIGLYSAGDRSDIALRTIATGTRDYRAAGRSIPVPFGVNSDCWSRILDELSERYPAPEDENTKSKAAA